MPRKRDSASSELTGPRHVLATPDLFGKSNNDPAVRSDSRPRNATHVALWAEAYAQHRFAVAVRREIGNHGLTQARVASDLGWDAGTFGPKLQGHDWFQPEELRALAYYFDDVTMLDAPVESREVV